MNNDNVSQFMLILFKYFWAVVIAIDCIGAVMTSFYMKQAPAKERLKMMLGWAFWTNVPWIVMGIGSTIGGVPTFFHFFRPKDGNPFVLAWWASVAAVFIIGSYWIFIGQGAAKLAEYGVIRYRFIGKPSIVLNEKGIKLYFLLVLTTVLIIGIIVWLGDVQIPPPFAK
jgi:hypothetical protein